MSDIEQQLDGIHKIIAQAAGLIVHMLVTRRLKPAGLEVAKRNCQDAVDRLQRLISKLEQGK